MPINKDEFEKLPKRKEKYSIGDAVDKILKFFKDNKDNAYSLKEIQERFHSIVPRNYIKPILEAMVKDHGLERRDSGTDRFYRLNSDPNFIFFKTE